MHIDEIIEKIMPVDKECQQKAQDRFDALIKPLGSLAQLETMTSRYAAILGKFKKAEGSENTIGMWIRAKEDSCYICSQYKDTYARYLDTFFYLWKNDENFRNKVINGKGFCLPHFGDLCEAADRKLSDKEKQDFYDQLLPVMESNMQRISEDVSWLVEKFDYRNKDADWKSSRDAIQRGMQKLKGGYPADPAYKMSK